MYSSARETNSSEWKGETEKWSKNLSYNANAFFRLTTFMVGKKYSQVPYNRGAEIVGGWKL